MGPITTVRRFARDESGAVSTDLVVLVALVVTLSVGLMISIGAATADSTDRIVTAIDDRGIPAY